MAIHRTETVDGPDGRILSVSVVAASSFEGATRDAIIGLKYRNERRNARLLASLLSPLMPPAVDVVTWAPTTRRRRMSRGIDHAELIARHLAADASLPAARLLRRLDDTRQTGADREERQKGAAFVAHERCEGARIVVVDDVITTGATIRAACSALARNRPSLITALCVASVPLSSVQGHSVPAPK